MAVSIRNAEPEDVPRLGEIALVAYRPYVAAIGREPAPMLADFATLVGEGVVRVACDAGVAGYAVSYASGPDWHLENIAVDPAIQGQGVGRLLIEDVERLARAAGAAAVELYTNQKMTANLALYPRLGFVETGRGAQDGFHRVFYRKLLEPGAFTVDTPQP